MSAAARAGRLLGRRSLQWIRRQLEYPRFARQWQSFRAAAAAAGDARFQLSALDLEPIVQENTATTAFDRHYVFHPAWAARKIAQLRPTRHVDIGSSLQFCAQISAFVPVLFLDYRPARLKLSGLTCGRGDLLALDFASDSVESLSCMHTVEHVGLGRYGDPIDPLGDLKAIRELSRVLSPGGSLLFVVPVGRPRVRFNAHRIYAYEQVVSAFDRLRLKEFTLIPDEGDLVENAPPALVAEQSWGCGCFWFTKE
jgi:SAM-dependent methyltransferase